MYALKVLDLSKSSSLHWKKIRTR